jgi:hypothetical protein
MALQNNLQSTYGVTFENAYIRVAELSGSKDILNIRVKWYVNQTARVNSAQPLQEQVYSFVPSVEDKADNFIKQGYNYLKTLEQFSTATDVLDILD